MTLRPDGPSDQPAQHQNDPVLPVERRARRPGMAIVLWFMIATIACAVLAYGDLLEPPAAWFAKIMFWVLLALFIAAAVIRVTRIGQRS